MVSIKQMVGKKLVNTLSTLFGLNTKGYGGGITSFENNPEVIREVMKSLEAADKKATADQLHALEKAIYLLSSRQVQLIEKVHDLEERTVQLQTTAEELLHDLETSKEPEEGITVHRIHLN